MDFHGAHSDAGDGLLYCPACCMNRKIAISTGTVFPAGTTLCRDYVQGTGGRRVAL